MTVAPFEVPLSPEPQSFNIALNGTTYGLTVTWCDAGGMWVLAIADSSGNPIVSGIPLITGADLLAQYKYLGIAGGGSLVCETDYDPGAVPTFTNLGSTGHLYFVSPP